jgi:hypothetical protein
MTQIAVRVDVPSNTYYNYYKGDFMKKRLYDTRKIDLTTHRLFDFEHQEKNTQRFDVLRYPKIDQLNDLMLSFYWRPEEISMNKDKSDYESNSDFYERFIVTEQLKKLVMLDSLQGGVRFSRLVKLRQIQNLKMPFLRGIFSRVLSIVGVTVTIFRLCIQTPLSYLTKHSIMSYL